jgi:hypothetical protein
VNPCYFYLNPTHAKLNEANGDDLQIS